MNDLKLLPKFRDSISSLYIEHSKIDRFQKSIAAHDADGYVPIPAASLAVLMLGPGTSITHEAVKTLADTNCLVIWCGEENVRFYASGMGGTRSATPLLMQARLATNEKDRLQVARRMYAMRFEEEIDEDITLSQLRGMEGARVRTAYATLSRETGVSWSGRNYDRRNWYNSDPINRAISAANACLYGVCHAAILSCGYSPAIGFIHTGKQLSFVYDIADLYKLEISTPIAFETVAQGTTDLERTVRKRCRHVFKETRLMQRVVPDIQNALKAEETDTYETSHLDEDPALPTALWTPQTEQVTGG